MTITDPSFISSPRLRAVLNREASVLLDVTNGRCYRLNDSAALVWTEITKGACLSRICSAVSAVYPDRPDACADVRAFVRSLEAMGLIERADQPDL